MSSLQLQEFLFSNYFGFNEEFFGRGNIYQLALDLLLITFVIYVLGKKPAKPEKPLSEKEMNDLIEEWEPEPMYTPLDERVKRLESRIPLITGSTATHVKIDDKDVVNLVRTNFHGFLGNKEIEKTAIEAVKKYGVGTCGPRGFYGTMDCHLELEQYLKNFLHAEAGIIYSYGYATTSSVIPTFSGREDIIVADEGLQHSVKTGIRLSRSQVHWFKHNDVNDLEKILASIVSKKGKLTRRWIVIEGLYANYGDFAPLAKIIELRNKYKFRVIMDDSYGIGLVGKTGRGTCEIFNVDPNEIEFITGSLETTVGSVGGFAVSKAFNVYHSRIHSPGYTYSASLPPLLNNAALASFRFLEKNPQIIQELSAKTLLVYQELATTPNMHIPHQCNGPFIHLRLKNPPSKRIEEEEILQDICDEALKNGVFITRAKYSEEIITPPASIRISICRSLSDEELVRCAKIIKNSAQKILGNLAEKVNVQTFVIPKDNLIQQNQSKNVDATPRRSTRLEKHQKK